MISKSPYYLRIAEKVISWIELEFGLHFIDFEQNEDVNDYCFGWIYLTFENEAGKIRKFEYIGGDWQNSYIVKYAESNPHDDELSDEFRWTFSEELCRGEVQ